MLGTKSKMILNGHFGKIDLVIVIERTWLGIERTLSVIGRALLVIGICVYV